MNVDIGRVLSTTFSMIRQRIWLMLGLWAVFFAISLVYSSVFGALLGATVMGAGMMAAGGLDDPLALGGAGLISFISIAVFYVLYLAIGFAQQASMTAMASPIEQPSFGDAMTNGFKAGLTSVVLLAALTFLGIILVLIASLVVAGLAAVNQIVAFAIGLAMLPLAIWLICRLALILPVVAVDRVFNPITAINRTWAVSRGKVLGIFIILAISLLSALVIIGLPLLAIIGGTIGLSGLESPDAVAGGIGAIVIALLIGFPLFLLYQVFSVALVASLHAQVNDRHIDQVTEVFE